MVQALQKIINFNSFSEAHIKEIFSKFRCIKPESQASKDVMSFLVNDAIEAEKIGTTRTYLILNDDEWAKGNIVIDGFFSIALKILYFAKEVDKNIIKFAFDDPTKKNCPAYLIAQVGRSEKSSKGSGAQTLENAIRLILNAKDIVGGRLIYLDCLQEKEKYYSRYGFEFLQKKHNSELIQMYLII